MPLGLHFICHNLVAYRTRKLNYIAKTTGRCAQYMGALKNFDNIVSKISNLCAADDPPRLLFPKFVMDFCSDRY